MKESLMITTATILENWGMFLVDRAPSSIEIFDVSQPFYIAKLQFKGCVSGNYQVLTQKKFADALVNNLLGELDQDEHDKAMQDALGELVNVLSGNLLTEQFGNQEVFDLTPPTVETVTEIEAKKYFSSQTFCYRADEEPIAVGCSLTTD